ncbi:hypothetical protein K439DRAFT_1099610 [Ramaria rubella]|nr:hypothetical protein K439DRAFT_1099610 [Ramaria rubella]
MERDAATAAMAAAGITRAPPLDDEVPVGEFPPMVQRPPTFFEDGTPVTGTIDQDLERNGGQFNPYLTYPLPPSRGNEVHALDGSELARSPSSVPSHTFSSAGYVYSELPTGTSNGNISSSHGHESHNGHEPLLATGTARSHSPSAYPLLTGSFQRRNTSQHASSEESYAPPVPPPHIFTSYASPRYASASQDSPKSEYSHPDDYEQDLEGLSPLDPQLGQRLRGGGSSAASVGLNDNEDYSARPRLEVLDLFFNGDKFTMIRNYQIRNRTGSQWTFGSETSKNH